MTRQAQTWLSGHGQAIEAAIAGLVQDIRTDGAAIGTASADAAVQAEQAAAAGSVTADMGSWTPGASSIARELVGQAGNGQRLIDLLDEAKVAIKSIAQTRLADLAKTLAEGVETGQSKTQLAQAVAGVLTDPSRAEMIVHTELARAVNSAAAWSYRFHGVEQVRWVTAEDEKVCPACDALEAEGARPLGGEQPPAHPWCRCALVPA